MTRPNILIIDVQSQAEVVREMNDEEYAQHLIDQAAFEAEQSQEATPTE